MKLRKYASYVTLVLLFAFGGFGSFYILTGENLITGQKRDVKSGTVLSESDNKKGLEKVAVENRTEKKPEYTKERMFFDKVMSKTKDRTSLQLNPTSGGGAAVFYRFGLEGGKYYLAVFASGIANKDTTLYSWLLDKRGKDKEVGELKIIDNSDVYKLALETDSDLSSYSTAVITATSKGEDPKKYDKNNVVYSADFDFSKELKKGNLQELPPKEKVGNNSNSVPTEKP